MSSDPIIGLPGFRYIESCKQPHALQLRVEYGQAQRCPYCRSAKLRKKDTFTRRIRHRSMGTTRTELELITHKFCCTRCHRYFNTRMESIAPYQRSTPLLKEELFQKHTSGISHKALSQQLGPAQATLERWFHERLELAMKKLRNRHCPKVLGIDEHFFTRKKGYATTFVDLSKHKVFDVALGRSESSLEAFLKALKGRENVRVVVMDLSSTYRALVQKYFPNALIVADRFHVVRLINHVFLQCWKRFDPVSRVSNRGLLSLMRRHEWRLDPSKGQREKLQSYLKQHPALDEIYKFKQKLNRLMLERHHTQRTIVPLIQKFLGMITALIDSPIEELSRLGQTLGNWKEPIARMWRFTKTNSITEGLHTKMEVIARRAYGFRNFQNYRIRVIVLCSGISI